ncbi:MAG: HEAT repeat domain-containing protein, partial [Asgard group archaeon]
PLEGAEEIKTTIKTEQKKALKPLKPQLKNETQYVLKVTAQAVRETFKGTGSSEALDELKPLLKDEDHVVRRAVAEAIRPINSG